MLPCASINTTLPWIPTYPYPSIVIHYPSTYPTLPKLINGYIFKPKCNCRRKNRQEKESVMVVWCKLKVPSLRMTVRQHSASLAMLNSYRRDRIFNPLLKAFKILIIKKLCNVRTFVTHEYELFFVHTYVTYENVIWPNICYTQKYDI